MIEMNEMQSEAVSGGLTVMDVIRIGQMMYGGAVDYVSGIGAVGATLSNYYGRDMAIEIVAAGNMGA